MTFRTVRLLTVATALALPFSASAQQNKNPKPAPDKSGAPNAPYANPQYKKMTCEEALKEAPKLNKDLVPLEKAMNEAQAKLKKNPKDAKLKKAYVDATYRYANTILTQPQGQMSPPVQYRAALALYRRVLAVDPKHEPSLKEKKTIEDIYKTMPGGVPK